MHFRHTPLAIATLTLIALAGCGGGGGGDSASVPTDSTITGVAAYGAPLAGAAVTASDADGHSASVTAGSDGSFSVKVTGFTAPILLRATATVGDTVREYLSVSDSVPGTGTSATINVTPLTHAVVAMVSSDGTNPKEFATDASKLRTLTNAKLTTALKNLRTSLATVLADLSLPSDFNPLTATFKADRTSGGDQLLDTIKVSLGDQGVTLLNARAALGSSDAGDKNSVTIKGLPSTAPAALPAPTVSISDIKGLDSWMTSVNNCLALAPSNRVSVDSNSKPTAFLGACNTVSGFSSSYLNSGYNLLDTWGNRLKYIPAGATMLTPEMLTFSKSDSGDTYAAVNLAYTSPTGGGSYTETAHKTSAGWVIEGNQRKYDAGVSVALIKSVDASTNPYAVPVISGYADSGKKVGRLSSYSSILFFRFDQSGPNGSDVYAVRVTGPGLPDAGLVFARSTACGTDNYLAFYRNNGALPVASTSAISGFTGTGNGWTIDATPLSSEYTGTDFFNQWRGINKSTGAPSSDVGNYIAPTTVAISAIPEFARYKWEVFTTAGGATAADTFHTRIVVRPLAAAEGAKQPWADFTAEAKEYVSPTGKYAGELTSATLGWTTSKGYPVVTSAYMTGYDGTNSSGMDGSVAYGASSASLTTVNEKDGSGATCSYSKLPAFTATTGSRAITTRQYTERRLQLQQRIFHSGRAG